MSICFWPTLQHVTAIPSSSPAGVITSDGQWTIVVADIVYNGGYVALPLGASIGDVVEVHNNIVNYNSGATVVASSGETAVGNIAATCFCRKISSSVWSCI